MSDYRVPPDLIPAALDRLTAAGVPAADRRTALAVLALLAAGLAPQSFMVRQNAGELSQRLGVPLADWPRVIGQLGVAARFAQNRTLRIQGDSGVTGQIRTTASR